MEYRRSAAPNDSPFFIEALADVVIEHLARRSSRSRRPRAAGESHTHGWLSCERRTRRRPPHPRIVVVGGGMTGLGAARALEDARAADPSIDWVLFEGEPRLGGKVQTVRRDGFVVEGGPDSAIVEKPWPIQMARRARHRRPPARLQRGRPPQLRLRGGRLHELPEGIILMVPTRIVPFALSGLISWPGKLRMGMDLVLPRGARGRRREPRRLRAPAARRRGAGAHRRADRGRHPRRRPRADERARDLPDVPRDGARAPQPDHRDARAAQGAGAREGGGGGLPGAAAATGAPSAASRDGASPRSYFYSFTTGLADLSDAMVASLPAERLRAGVGRSRRWRAAAPVPGRGRRQCAVLARPERRHPRARRRRRAGRAGLRERRPAAHGRAARRRRPRVDRLRDDGHRVAGLPARPDRASAARLRLRRAARRGPRRDGDHVELEQVRRPRARGRTSSCAASSAAPGSRRRRSSTTTR